MMEEFKVIPVNNEYLVFQGKALYAKAKTQEEADTILRRVYYRRRTC